MRSGEEEDEEEGSDWSAGTRKEGRREGGRKGRTVRARDVGIRQLHYGNDAGRADLVRAVVRLITEV